MNNMNGEAPRREVNVKDGGLTRFFGKVYGILALGIAVSAVAAYFALAGSNYYIAYTIASNRLLFFGLFIAEFALVIYLSSRVQDTSNKPLLGFIAYSVINGLTISLIIAMFAPEVAVLAFVAAAATYGITALIGLTIKKDLSGMGHAAIVLLVGVIIATVINMFAQLSGLDMFITYLTVLIFAGLTAYDHQKIKTIYLTYGEDVATMGLATTCALNLYLDFINLFLAFIRIFGKRN